MKSYCGNCNVVDSVDYVADIDAPDDYSWENIPTRGADYIVAGGDTYFEYDSDGDMYMGLRDSSSDEDEKRSEEKFVRRVKRRTLRRRIRLERRRRGRDTEWSVEEMVQWLVTPESDPDWCSPEDSLTDFASDEIAEDSDGVNEPNEHRRDFSRDTICAHEHRESRHDGE